MGSTRAWTPSIPAATRTHVVTPGNIQIASDPDSYTVAEALDKSAVVLHIWLEPYCKA
jgi:hypothetical protein